MYKLRYLSILIVMVLLVVTLSVACQATPEKNVVVDKRELEDKAKIEADKPQSIKSVDGRITWEEQRILEKGTELEYNLTVEVDAMPDKYPDVIPVLKQEDKEMDIKYAQKFFDYFAPDAELLQWGRTKQDIDMELYAINKWMHTADVSAETKQNVEEYKEQILKFSKDKPEKNKAFRFADNPDCFAAKTYIDDARIAYISVGNSSGYRVEDFVTEFESSKEPLPNMAGNNAIGQEIKYKEAFSLAEQTVSNLCLNPMKLLKSELIHPTGMFLDDDTDGNINQAYAFYYTPVYEGIQGMWIHSLDTYGSDLKEIEYAEQYGAESAAIVINDDGIVRFDYSYAAKTTEVINKNVEVLPFDEVFEKFKSAIFYKSLWGMGNIHMKVTDIEFGMTKHLLKNNSEEYMIIPAWRFYGTIERNNYTNEGDFIVLSAIDGSILQDHQWYATIK